MAFPSFVLTRQVTIGGAMTLVGAENIVLSAVIESSRGLIWDATGYRFEKFKESFTSTPGGEISVTLPRTDVAGWRAYIPDNAPNSSLIDVSVSGSFTHTYTAKVNFLSADGKSLGVSELTIGPFPLPNGDGSPVDLDRMMPGLTVSGTPITLPDILASIAASATAAAGSATAAAASLAAMPVWWTGTQAAYNALGTYSATTLYLVTP